MNKPVKPATILTVSVGATPTKLLSSSPERRALRISVQGADVYIAPTHTVAVGHGFRVVNGQHSEELCACHVGQWVTMEMWAITPAGTALVHIIEGFEERE